MAVRLFYEDYEFSTMHPGKKVSVRDEDGRVQTEAFTPDKFERIALVNFLGNLEEKWVFLKVL